MLQYRPHGLQRRRYSFAAQLLVLGCLGAALYVCTAALVANRASQVLDANANPVMARDYGFPAVQR